MEWLQRFAYADGYIAIAVDHPSRIHYVKSSELTSVDPPHHKDVFFGPAMRQREGNDKEDILGSIYCWVDVDDLNYPQFTFPPTLVVNSGHGWHLYWKLTIPVDPSTLELYNKALAGDISTADSGSWNCNRVLRVPGTTNTGDPSSPVRLHREYDYEYEPGWINTLSALDSKTRHKIRTGDRRGYRSRSERDWAVISALMEAEAPEDLIRFLFKNQPIGDKVNDPTTPESYLDKSIAEAKRKTAIKVRRDVEERADGYYDYGGRGARRLSTFVISPRILLDATGQPGGEDAIMGDVTASGHTWSGITFTRSAFTSVVRLDRETPVAAWQWLGRDDDVRRLLPHLLDKLKEQGMPRVVATPVLGLHQYDGEWYFVGDKQTFSQGEVWDAFTGRLASLPTTRERPRVIAHRDIDSDRRRAIRDALAVLTPAGIRSTITGWYFATPLKPYVETLGLRFPVLNVTGTRGSGKTTLVQRVFMPLLGIEDPRTYDSGTTRFVTLALLGGTNAIPIAFSEFRFGSVPGFIRYVLLAYDTGHDPRGRSDLSTVDNPLHAPFSVDGEDMISDPAAQERILVAQLHPQDISEGTAAQKAYSQFRELDLSGFGTSYIMFVLKAIHTGRVVSLADKAIAASFDAFPGRLPERVRNNHVVAYIGLQLYSEFVEAECPPFSDLQSSIERVYDVDSGRGRVMVDDFVEALVAAAVDWTAPFRWQVEGDSIFRFQMSSAHDWWLAARRRQGQTALEREAIVSQLKEAEYYVSATNIGGAYMYGVDLVMAQGVGLDVVTQLRRPK